jgi:uncharacterized protein
MHARVKTLIATLQLQPHPEGGWYRETFRAARQVRRESDGTQASSLRLGADAAWRLHVVPAGWWQAARPLGDHALVGCAVGPGFDFADFALLGDLPAAERPPPPGLSVFARFL